jgi:dipeptidyl aminopeptidase/acylaminoacyl peptidase
MGPGLCCSRKSLHLQLAIPPNPIIQIVIVSLFLISCSSVATTGNTTATQTFPSEETAESGATPTRELPITPMMTTSVLTETPAQCFQDYILVLGYPYALLPNVEYGHYFVCEDGSSMRLLTNEVLSEPSISPNGSMIAFSHNEKIYLLGLSGDVVKTIRVEGLARSPSWSQEGGYIAYVRDEQFLDEQSVEIIHVETGTVSTSLLPAGFTHPRYEGPIAPRFVDIAWSPQGANIALRANYNTLYVADIACDSVTHTCAMDGIHSVSDQIDSNPSWSPDGTRLAAFHYEYAPDRSQTNQNLVILDMDGHWIRAFSAAELSLDLESASSLAWSPDGNRIAFSAEHAVWILSLEDDTLTNLTEELIGTDDFGTIAWLP